MKTADKFTLVRIILAPLFYVLYFLPTWINFNPIISVVIIVPLLIFAEFTDFLDGFFARRLNQVSDFGKLFDPFADVLLHLTTFFCFVVSGYMPAIIFLFIMYREFIMNFIRLLAIKEGIAIAARWGGKLKTVLYVITGFFYLIFECCERMGFDFLPLTTVGFSTGFFLSCVCLVAAYVSFIDYLVHFLPMMSKKSEKKVEKGGGGC